LAQKFTLAQHLCEFRVFERSIIVSPVTPLDDIPTPTGRVEIAEPAIVAVIHESVLSCYGVVDLGPRSSRSALRRRLRRTDPARGIEIETIDGTLRIDLSIVVEYGTPIFTVAQNVMQTVKFQVERLLDMTVDRVNVNVDGLRVSTPDEKTA
jgi:uncharacterized alkaline shock family protein YloU